MTQLGDRVFGWMRRRPLWMIVITTVLIVAAILLASCAQQRIGVELYDPNVYTRAEVDAIQSEMQCKQTARTQIEVARCIGNRRGP